jgi:hypothetical protein
MSHVVSHMRNPELKKKMVWLCKGDWWGNLQEGKRQKEGDGGWIRSKDIAYMYENRVMKPTKIVEKLGERDKKE